MTEKSKKYLQIKFPYQVISDAIALFRKSLSPKQRKEIYTSWDVSYSEEDWKFDTEEQFRAEYNRDEIVRASLSLYNLDFHLRISYDKGYRVSVSRISISLSSIDKIEKVFSVFDSVYAKFREEQLEQEAKEKEEKSQAQSLESEKSAPYYRSEKPAPYYRFDVSIPSTLPDIRSLASIEKYIHQRAGQLVNNDEESPQYAVVISDSMGTLSIKTIEEFPYDLFDNKTDYINLKYGRAYSDFEIDLKFHKDRYDSKLRIAYKGENSRDVVESIKIGILKLLGDIKTNNWLYHLPTLQTIIILQLFLCGVLAVIYYLQENPLWLQVSAIFIFDIVYLIAPRYKPYTTFDTRQNQSIIRWNRWLIESILAALLGWFLLSWIIPVIFP
jgi:hypothetical protein